MLVEIKDEAVSDVVRQDLLGLLAGLKQDLQRHKDGKWCAIFTTNKKEDVKQIKAMISAIEVVLSYYGG